MLDNDGDSADPHERFYVKRPDGKVLGPFEIKDIQLMLKSDKIEPDAEMSADREDWKPLSSHPELEAYVPDVENDPQSATHMGLPRSATEDEGGTSSPDLPTSAEGGGTEDNGGLDLPAPADDSDGGDDERRLDLPVSADSTENGEPELPTSTATSPSGGGESARSGSSDDSPLDLPASSDKETSDEGLFDLSDSAAGEGDDGEALDLPAPADDLEGDKRDPLASVSDKNPLDDGSDRTQSSDGNPLDLPAPADDSEDDAPDLPTSASGDEPSLPRSAESSPSNEGGDGGLDLPAPADDSEDDAPDLPTSASGDEPSLPRSAESSPSNEGGDGGLDLPAPADDSEDNAPDLPTSASGDEPELPRAADDDPSDRSAAAEDGRDELDLPQLAEQDADLPESTEAPDDGLELPESAEAEPDMPASAESGNPDLPAASDSQPGEVELGSITPEAKPRGEIENDSPESHENHGGELPRSVGGDDAREPSSADAKGATSSGRASSGSGDDPFADDGDDPFASKGSDPFGEDDAPFDEDEDDLFSEGAEDDDPFADDHESGGDVPLDDDLFDGDEGESPDGDDPLAAEDDDDFLAGEDSFSFLEGEDDDSEKELGVETQTASPSADDGDGSPEAPLPDEPATPAADPNASERARDEPDESFDETSWDDASEETSGLELDASNDGGASSRSDDTPRAKPERDETFQPASPGIPAQEREEEESSEKASDTGEDSTSTVKIAALVVGGLAVIGAAYVYAGDMIGPSQKKKQTKTKAQPEIISLNLAPLETDSHAAMRSLIDKARANRVEGQDRGKLLFVEALFTSRYDDSQITKQAESLVQSLLTQQGPYYTLGVGAWRASQGRPEAAQGHLRKLRAPEDDSSSDRLQYFARLSSGMGYVRGLETREATTSSGQEAAPRNRADAGAGGSADKGKSYAEKGMKFLEQAAEQRSKLAAPLYWLGRLHEHRGASDKALEAYERALERQSDHVPSRLRAAHLDYRSGHLEPATDRTDTILEELGSVAAPSETAEAYHIRGEIHIARSQSKEAIDAFKKAIQKDPNRPETLVKLAETYEHTEDYQAALDFFTSNDSLGRDHPEVLLGIVRAHMGLGQWQKAISQLEHAEKTFPQDARFPYFLGKLHRKRGAFSEARQSMQRAIERDETLLEAYGILAQLSWRLDKDTEKGEGYVQHIARHSQAIDADVSNEVAKYYRMIGEKKLAEQWYQSALQHNPNSWTARLDLAMLYLDTQKTEKALDILEQAREDGVQDVRLSAHLADAYRQAEKYDKALEEINKVLETNPESSEYIFIRGRIHFDRGNYQTARRDFNKAYEFDPRFHKAYFYVGRTAFKQGDYKNALKIFRHVLDYQPNKGEFHYWMGRTFEALGQRKKALSEYQETTKVDDQYGDNNPKIYIRRGRLLLTLDLPEDGKQEIARALERRPDMTEALMAMGQAAFKSKHYQTSIDYYERALEKQPEAPKAHYRLGMSLVYTDQRREAARHLQKAIEYGYENPEIYETLGYLYKDLGKRQLAVESFKSYLKKSDEEDISNATRRQMLQQIKNLGG